MSDHNEKESDLIGNILLEENSGSEGENVAFGSNSAPDLFNDLA